MPIPLTIEAALLLSRATAAATLLQRVKSSRLVEFSISTEVGIHLLSELEEERMNTEEEREEMRAPRSEEEKVVQRKKRGEKKGSLGEGEYKEDYVLLGFTNTNSDPPEALCFFCGERLANSSMKPAHLQRLLKTKHQCHVGKPVEFFKRELSDFQCSQKVFQKATTTSGKALKALTAKAKKPFGIAEELILPAAGMMVEIMLDKKTADQLKAVPLSHQTVSLRMISKNTNYFAKKLEEYTTGEAIFNVINQFFSEQELSWKSCMSMCTDAAASMTGKVKGLVARVKKVNPDVEWTHCIIHRES
ncbi:zinc finger MYM-type protein 6-like [Macrobrachium nipponense]|uniref:zinc finger MYM-type protein 6-like n=1 Tax=Macrobrachium nipponense TaxID=159736 RepID=UPI0030C7BE9A